MKLSSYVFILLSLTCLTVSAADPAAPIDVSENVDHYLEEVTASVFSGNFFPTARPSRLQAGVGRSYWSLGEETLSTVRLPQYSSHSVKLLRQGAAALDLWRGVELLKSSPGSGLLIEFRLYAKMGKKVALGVGCTGEFLVFLNGQSVYGVASLGHHDFMRSQHLIPIELKNGDNLVQIATRRPDAWDQVPNPHSSNQWSLGVDVFKGEDEAWAVSRSRNFSLVDTPVVSTISDLRIDAVVSGVRIVDLFDINGRHQTRGELHSDGSVSWDSDATNYPFIGFMSYKGTTDAVIALGNTRIEDLTNLLKDAVSNDQVAWIYRARHLLKPEFSKNRHHWWSRKLALCVTMALSDLESPDVADLLRKYRRSHIRFAAYTSKIDGTKQYYRIYNKFGSEHRNQPLLFLLPTVEDKIHTYLESADVADQLDAEVMSDLAQQSDVICVWPGISEVDQGGELARRALDECIEDVKNKLGITSPRVYVQGTCSSGLFAVGYAETRPIDGLVLQSPVVHRTTHRWLKGLDMLDVTYPQSFLSKEQVDDKWSQLKDTPTYLAFNLDMPGHGDSSGSRTFVSAMRELAGDIEDYWPTPELHYVWGERLRVQEAPVFDWIRRKNSSAGQHTRAESPISQRKYGVSTKDAMLNGFVVNPPKDIRLQNWFSEWNNHWKTFRGDYWNLVSDEPIGKTRVKGRVMDMAEIDKIKLGLFADGEIKIQSPLAKYISGREQLWGFRLISDDKGWVVEVLRSEAASGDLPKVDLVVDGIVAGAVWVRTQSGWKLLFASTPRN